MYLYTHLRGFFVLVLSGVLPKYLFSMKEFKTIAEECVEILAATTLHLVQAVVFVWHSPWVWWEQGFWSLWSWPFGMSEEGELM